MSLHELPRKTVNSSTKWVFCIAIFLWAHGTIFHLTRVEYVVYSWNLKVKPYSVFHIVSVWKWHQKYVAVIVLKSHVWKVAQQYKQIKPKSVKEVKSQANKVIQPQTVRQYNLCFMHYIPLYRLPRHSMGISISNSHRPLLLPRRKFAQIEHAPMIRVTFQLVT